MMMLRIVKDNICIDQLSWLTQISRFLWQQKHILNKKVMQWKYLRNNFYEIKVSHLTSCFSTCVEISEFLLIRWIGWCCWWCWEYECKTFNHASTKSSSIGCCGLLWIWNDPNSNLSHSTIHSTRYAPGSGNRKLDNCAYNISDANSVHINMLEHPWNQF